MRFPTSTLRWPFLLLPLVLGAVACADAGPPSDREPAAGERQEALFANDQTIYNYFVGKGLTSFQAAGIVGNIDQESGGDPMASQPGGPGRGIAQWSVGGRWDHDANDNLADFAMGQSVWSLQVQLDFIWYELTTFSGYGLAAIKASSNVTDATVAFQDKFEGCGTCDQTKRVQYAMDVLAAYGNTAPPDYAAQFVSQTYPYASVGAVMLMSGDTVTGNIVMKNVGAKTWKAGETKLAPIPRDQPSPFQSASWPTNARVSTVAQDVAPGADGTFEWDFTGSTPGDFSPFFGFVEEGVAWFADSGGPADNVVQVHIIVTPGSGPGAGGAPGTGGSGPGAGGSPAGTGGSPQAMGMGGSPAGTGGAASAGKGGTTATGAGGSPAAGHGGSAGTSPGKGGSSAAGNGGSATGAGGQSATVGAGGTSGGGATGAAGRTVSIDDETVDQSSGGCSVDGGPSRDSWVLAILAPLVVLVRRRRRSAAASTDSAVSK